MTLVVGAQIDFELSLGSVLYEFPMRGSPTQDLVVNVTAGVWYQQDRRYLQLQSNMHMEIYDLFNVFATLVCDWRALALQHCTII